VKAVASFEVFFYFEFNGYVAVRLQIITITLFWFTVFHGFRVYGYNAYHCLAMSFVRAFW